MDSFGATLQNAREIRGIDLERASHETNISQEFLDALEKELITRFPGETYLMGYLRNYAEYLGLDGEAVVGMYRSVQKQLEPAPLNLLLEPKKKIPWYAVSGLLFVICIASVATVLVIRSNAKRAAMQEVAKVVTPTQKTYRLENVPMEKRLYKGDSVEVMFEQNSVTLTVADTIGSLSLETPYGTQIVELGEEAELDLDGVPGGEVSVYVSDISERDASRGAEVQMLKILSLNEAPQIAAPGAEETEPMIADEIPTGDSTDRTVIFEGNTAYPITLNAVFRASCLFRYRADRGENVEDFISSGETVSFSANNGFRLWMSNANAVKLQVIGSGRTVDLEFGRPGQVLVEDIKWIKDDDGKYKLVVLNVD